MPCPECYIAQVTFTVEIEREEKGRWIAEVPALPGVLCYGQDRDEAVGGVQALALRVIAERLEKREALGPRILSRIAKHTGLTPSDL